MQKAGLTIPIMVGGATTSKLHTAIKIAPHYDYPVIHVLDASQNPLIAAKLLNPDTRDAYIENLNNEYEALRASMEKKKEVLVSLSEARANHPDTRLRRLPRFLAGRFSGRGPCQGCRSHATV